MAASSISQFTKKSKSDVYIYFNPSASSILFPDPHLWAKNTQESSRDHRILMWISNHKWLYSYYFERMVEKLNHAYKCDKEETKTTAHLSHLPTSPTWNTRSMNHKMRAGDFSVASALKTSFVKLMRKTWSLINRRWEKISRDYSKCHRNVVVLKYVTIESHLSLIKWDLKAMWVFSTRIYALKPNT